MKKIIMISIIIIIVVLIGGNYLKRVYVGSSMSVSSNSVIQSELSTPPDRVKVVPKVIQTKIIPVDQVKIPILMYHSISNDDPNNSLLVSVEQFSNEMKWLSENGYTPMLMGDVVDAMNTGIVPEKPVAITFDDGYEDNYSKAFPILKENGLKATFFIITNNTDKDSYYMNSKMLIEMRDAGMGIENHTANHIELNKASKEEKIKDIKEAKEYLKDKIGVDSKFLCYPVGRYDECTIECAKSLGIEAAVTTNSGVATIGDGELSLKRYRVRPMSLESFKTLFEN